MFSRVRCVAPQDIDRLSLSHLPLFCFLCESSPPPPLLSLFIETVGLFAHLISRGLLLLHSPPHPFFLPAHSVHTHTHGTLQGAPRDVLEKLRRYGGSTVPYFSLQSLFHHVKGGVAQQFAADELLRHSFFF